MANKDVKCKSLPPNNFSPQTKIFNYATFTLDPGILPGCSVLWHPPGYH